MLWMVLFACGTVDISDTQQEKVLDVQGERSTGGCATSCAVKKTYFARRVVGHDAWAAQEVGVSTKELDTLLFYGMRGLTFGVDQTMCITRFRLWSVRFGRY